MIPRAVIATLAVIAVTTGAPTGTMGAVRMCQQTVSSGEVVADSEFKARRLAIIAWQASVQTAYGEAFTAWRLAQPKAAKCLEVARGFACVALGRPCKVQQVAPPGSRGGKRSEQPV